MAGPSDLDSLSLRYNAMRSYGPQSPAFREATQARLGPIIARIFIKHQMHREYQLCLLHRHHDLPTDCAMVYTCEEPDKYTCSMQTFGPEEVFPCSYLMSNGSFEPFEFSLAKSRVAPTDVFLVELADALQEHGLDRVVGITKALPPQHLWKEELSRTGMICSKAAPEDMAMAENYITTQWAFEETSAGLGMKAVKACEETPAGHRRTG